MQRITKSIILCTVVSGLALGGCGGAGNSTPKTRTTLEAVRAAAREMSPHDGRSEDERVMEFEELLMQLRSVPQLAPLVDMYGVPMPVDYDDDEEEYDDDDVGGLVALLHAVRITVDSGTVTITNRQTGGVIFTAPLSDLASGVFYPENLPSGPGLPPPACTYSYSEWTACDPATLTQTRTVVSATPPGCTGTPVLSQPCVVGGPPPMTCTSFTYSPWGPCQPNNTQTRTVLTSSPAGCTGGSPVTTQACVYTPPLDGAALYGQYCSGCHGPLATSNLKGRNMSLASIKAFNMTQGLNDAQLQAIVTAVGP